MLVTVIVKMVRIKGDQEVLQAKQFSLFFFFFLVQKQGQKSFWKKSEKHIIFNVIKEKLTNQLFQYNVKNHQHLCCSTST